jgi:hypothetical protein
VKRPRPSDLSTITLKKHESFTKLCTIRPLARLIKIRAPTILSMELQTNLNYTSNL